MSKNEFAFTKKEIQFIEHVFPKTELPLHLYFRSNVRKKTTKKYMIVAVSPHFVKFFEQKKLGQEPTCMSEFHISEIEKIYYADDDSLLINTKETSYEISSKDFSLPFARILYRNYSLIHYQLSGDYDLEVNTNQTSKFPEIELDISASQRFQFYFASLCSKQNVLYRHDVVRYMNSIITTVNPIINLNKISRNAFEKDNSVLQPLIDTLAVTKFARGITLEHFSIPDMLQCITPLFMDEETSGGLRLIHLNDCDLTDDFSAIRGVVEEKNACYVSYWNLDCNPKIDFENFVRIIELSLSKVYYLSFSNCSIDESTFCSIFTALSGNPNCWEIRTLGIGGLDLSERSIEKLEKFLSTLNRKKANKIFSLDISSNSENFEKLFKMIDKELPNLEVLNLSNNDLSDENYVILLAHYIQQSHQLKELDLSGTNFFPDALHDIIHHIAKNDYLTNFILKLNSLGLHGRNSLALFRAFLSVRESADQKWRAIHLDSNQLDGDDLLNLVPLFRQFPRLNTLSFSYNLDRSIENIEEILCKLQTISSIKNITIAGDKDHALGEKLGNFLTEPDWSETKLQSIDISGNEIDSNICMQSLKLIETQLSSFSIRDTEIKSLDTLNDFIVAVGKNPNFISFDFPTVPVSKKQADLNSFAQNVGELQSQMNEIINKHRRKKGLCNELPADINQKFDFFIKEMTDDYNETFKNIHRWKHSCVSDIFNLPLPFQKTTDKADNFKLKKRIDIGRLDVYDVDSMKYIACENIPEGVDQTDEDIKPRKVEPEIKEPKPKNDDSKFKKKNADAIKPIKTVVMQSNDFEGIDDPTKKKSKIEKKKSTRKYITGYSDSSSSEEEEPRKRPKPSSRNKRKVSSSSYSDDSYEHPKKKKKTPKEISSDDDDDEIKRQLSKKQKATKRTVIDDIDELGLQTRGRPVQKGKSSKNKIMISSDSDDNTRKRNRKNLQKRSHKNSSSDYDEIDYGHKPSRGRDMSHKYPKSSDSEDFHYAPKRGKDTSVKRAAAPKFTDSSDDEEKLFPQKKSRKTSPKGMREKPQKRQIKRDPKLDGFYNDTYYMASRIPNDI